MDEARKLDEPAKHVHDISSRHHLSHFELNYGLMPIQTLLISNFQSICPKKYLYQVSKQARI